MNGRHAASTESGDAYGVFARAERHLNRGRGGRGRERLLSYLQDSTPDFSSEPGMEWSPVADPSEHELSLMPSASPEDSAALSARQRAFVTERTRQRVPLRAALMAVFLLAAALLIWVWPVLVGGADGGMSAPSPAVTAPLPAGTTPTAGEARTPGTSAESPSGGDIPPSGSSSGPVDVMTVHVSGAVRNPGVHKLKAPARVIDAMNAAGGPTTRAVLAAINLAAPVTDGQAIWVPVNGETGPPEVRVPAQHASSGAENDSQSGSGVQAKGSAAARDGPVNINTADSQELQKLPRIGPALAGRILAFRESHGPFGSVDDLDAVPGIGPTLLGSLRDLVVVR